MMNSINPSVAEIDGAMNLLSVLELAKDATKLKAALGEIKDAQDALAADRAATEKAVADAKKQADALAKTAAELESRRVRLEEEHAKAVKNSEAIEFDRAAIKEERSTFDAWMAAQREALDADKAKVDSDAVANSRRADDLKALEDAAARRARDAEDAIQAADAKRAEYEAKIENLKAMVG